MMFFAIFLRIKEYGLTENRFLVMAAGVWVIISLIYFIFYRNNSNISVPIFLSIIILLSGVGPAPATKLSIKSQSSRFEKLLNTNNMIVGEDRVDKLSYVPKDFKLNEDSFTKLFGFSNRIDDNTYIGYSYSDSISNGNDLNFDVNISGYSNLIYVYSLDDIVTSGNYKFEKTKNKIKIYKKEDEEYNLELSINLSELKEKVKTLRKTKESISPEDLSIVEDSYKIIFTNIYFADEENLENSYIDFYFLTK